MPDLSLSIKVICAVSLYFELKSAGVYAPQLLPLYTITVSAFIEALQSLLFKS